MNWEHKSREMALSVRPDGTIIEQDARAERMLAKGPSLLPSAVTEDKVKRMLTEQVDDGFEVSLLIEGKPRTVSFCQHREGDVVHLYGHVMPERYGNTVTQLNDTLSELANLNREAVRQTRELDESHQAILALHAELKEKAETLQRSADVKGRVVSNVSHEFRTPVHAVLGLTRLLLDSSLDEEQRKQVAFIRTAAEELSTLINDLLDLSKIEAGRVMLHADKFNVSDLFVAMRGVMRPLLETDQVDLRFDTPAPDITLDTDQGKIGQVLRNLVSNALKFTERGEVAVSAQADGDFVCFQVRDTGVGIAPGDLLTVFEEFGQIDNVQQRRTKGTGLGLPLSRRIAEMLGGTLTVSSEVGIGSTFTLRIPRVHMEVREMALIANRPLDPAKIPVLVVEDDRKTFFIYEKYLALAGFQAVPARTIADAHARMKQMRPVAVMLDIMLEGETSWQFLAELKRNPATRDIPVLVVTVTGKEQTARALGADEFWLKPVDPDRLIKRLRSQTRGNEEASVLIIDDEESARYLVRKFLEGTKYKVLEAATGDAGVGMARDNHPDIILLDFLLKESTAFDVLDQLKSDPRTRAIPVIIVTSQVLDVSERSRLASQTQAVVSKEHLSRELALSRIRDTLTASGLVRVK